MPDEGALNGAPVQGQPDSGTGALNESPSDLALDTSEGSVGADPSAPKKGTTDGESSRQYQELQKKLGEQGRELGELRQREQQYRGYLQQLQANQDAQARYAAAQQQQQQGVGAYPQEPVIPANQFFEDPAGAVNKMMEAKMGRLGQQVTGALEAERYNQAAMAARSSINEAKRMYPEAFQGLGNEVEQTIYAGVRNRVVPPQALYDPNTYAQLAWAIQGQRKGFRSGTPVTPVSPVQTNAPGRGGRMDSDMGADDVELAPMNEEMRKGLRLAGYDPDKVQAKTKARIADERKAKGGGR
jgi:hypothetical protein